MMVLDTCALVWWTLDPEKLSEKATEVCNKVVAIKGREAKEILSKLGD